jgi:hypothetical protein
MGRNFVIIKKSGKRGCCKLLAANEVLSARQAVGEAVRLA